MPDSVGNKSCSKNLHFLAKKKKKKATKDRKLLVNVHLLFKSMATFPLGPTNADSGA